MIFVRLTGQGALPRFNLFSYIEFVSFYFNMFNFLCMTKTKCESAHPPGNGFQGVDFSYLQIKLNEIMSIGLHFEIPEIHPFKSVSRRV